MFCATEKFFPSTLSNETRHYNNLCSADLIDHPISDRALLNRHARLWSAVF